MMIGPGPAQMIIPGPETGHGHYPAWLVHNNSETVPVYADITPAIMPVAGTAQFVIAPGDMLALSGLQTFWAITPAGQYADLHMVPTGTYAVTAPATAVTTGFGGP